MTNDEIPPEIIELTERRLSVRKFGACLGVIAMEILSLNDEKINAEATLKDHMLNLSMIFKNTHLLDADKSKETH